MEADYQTRQILANAEKKKNYQQRKLFNNPDFENMLNNLVQVVSCFAQKKGILAKDVKFKNSIITNTLNPKVRVELC